MADKPEPLQYVEAALKTPGRGASICFVITVVAGVWIGVDSIRPIFSELPQIRSLVWLFLLGAPIVGVVLALLHYSTLRKRPEPIPEFEVPTLGKPKPAEGEFDIDVPLGRVFTQGSLPINTVVRPLGKATPGTPRAGPPPVEPTRPVQKSLQTRLDHLSTRGRDYLRLIKALGLTLIEGHYQETTLVELVKADFLLQLKQSPEGRAQFLLSSEGSKALDLIKPDIIPPSFTGRHPWDP